MVMTSDYTFIDFDGVILDSEERMLERKYDLGLYDHKNETEFDIYFEYTNLHPEEWEYVLKDAKSINNSVEIIKELEKKPIVIKTLNTRVDTARDLVFKLYNTTKNILKNAYLSENLIVYANRYRSTSGEVMKVLNKAEIMFYKGNYEGAVKLVLDLLDKEEPGFKNKFNKELG